MKRQCKRCQTGPGRLSRIRAWVADAAFYDVVEEEVSLCTDCRVAAGQENARALSRRTGLHWRPVL
jgi:hypothetical protein